MSDSVLRESAHPVGEDDFEFVHSHAQENDDLSSLTSTSGGTDVESDDGCDESQARSDVTLQMPNVDDASASMQQAARRMTQPTGDRACDGVPKALDLLYDLPIVHDPLQCLDLKSGETVELPIFYSGPVKHKAAILQKLADSLLQHFSEDVWTSERYSVLPSKDHSSASLVPQSRISLRLISNADEVNGVDRPVIVICLLSGDTIASKSGLSSHLVDDLVSSGVPFLHLLESSLSDSDIDMEKRRCLLSTRTGPRAVSVQSSDEISVRQDPEPTGSTNSQRPLTLEEFASLKSDQLSKAFLPCIDAWNELRRHATRFACSATDSGYPAISQIIMWTLFLLTMAYSVYRTGASPMDGLAHFGNGSTSTIAFHQITETSTLIELPLRYRAQAKSDVPDVITAVTRDGKLIQSRMQLVVDNLYSLDWAQSEAHGELVVAAEMKGSKAYLTEAYVVVYSSKTPFLHAITEKLRDLNHLGHLTPDVDLTRRVTELMKQVEDSRSFVVRASKHQLKSIKEHGSQGIKKIQEDYSDVLRGTTKTLRHVLSSTSSWTDSVNKIALGYGSESLIRASRGVKKIRDAVERQKTKTTKQGRPSGRRSGKK